MLQLMSIKVSQDSVEHIHKKLSSLALWMGRESIQSYAMIITLYCAIFFSSVENKQHCTCELTTEESHTPVPADQTQ